jgi:hypothetical protein
MAMAAKMPMMATTIINSMSVKPFCTCLNIEWLLLINTQKIAFRTTACADDNQKASAVPNIATQT